MSQRLFNPWFDKEGNVISGDTITNANGKITFDDALRKPLEHPLDGKIYDSRSKYDAVTRALGGEEIGPFKESVQERSEKKDQNWNNFIRSREQKEKRVEAIKYAMEVLKNKKYY